MESFLQFVVDLQNAQTEVVAILILMETFLQYQEIENASSVAKGVAIFILLESFLQ